MSHTPLRVIVDPPASGCWNMAVDEALLQAAAENDEITLRFYRWNEPTLSLGYFQRYAAREHHPPSRNCPVIRRQSGGGAILHDHELTYSLAIPTGHALAADAERLYRTVHETIIAELRAVAAREASTWELQLRPRAHVAMHDVVAPEPFLCFQRKSYADVVFVARADGAAAGAMAGIKVVGSAQRRRRGAILQHGSILLDRSAAAPELPGINDVVGSSVAAADLATVLAGQVAARLGHDGTLERSELGPTATQSALRLQQTKYATTAWRTRR